MHSASTELIDFDNPHLALYLKNLLESSGVDTVVQTYRYRRLLLLFEVFCFFVLALPNIAYSQSALDGFNPNTDGEVDSIALQADGKILISGSFFEVNSEPRYNLARLNADGSVDPDFAPNVNSYVECIGICVRNRCNVLSQSRSNYR